MISPSSTGSVVASATIDGANNQVRRQDGAWISTIGGADNNAVTFDKTKFGDIPRCLCSAMDVTNRACNVRSAPDQFGGVHLEVTDQDGVTVDSDFSLICIGKTP